MRHAVLCAAIPFAQITQAFLTSTLLFGGAVVLLAVVQFLVALLSRCRWRP
jgi:heme/copper-type cytochrome/quinol oxidase subunit 4